MAANLKPIHEQVVVITGASSGIGLATALTFARKGAKVVLAARSDETLSDIVQQITSAGGDAIAVHCDVTNRAELQRLAETAVAKYGRIDTWVNNAGVSIYGRLDQVTEEDSRRLFDINFWGLVNGSLVALPYFKATGGALINLGSEVSDAVVPLQAMYSASKHAVKGFTDGLRMEIVDVDKAPVAITLIQPTAIDTPYPQHARNYLSQEAKLPTPQEDPQKVADAIVDAAEHETKFVRVGAMSVVNTIAAKVMPSVAEKMAATYVHKQTYEEPPRDPAGTLHKPGYSGQIRGSGGVESPPSSRN